MLHKMKHEFNVSCVATLTTFTISHIVNEENVYQEKFGIEENLEQNPPFKYTPAMIVNTFFWTT